MFRCLACGASTPATRRFHPKHARLVPVQNLAQTWPKGKVSERKYGEKLAKAGVDESGTAEGDDVLLMARELGCDRLRRATGRARPLQRLDHGEHGRGLASVRKVAAARTAVRNRVQPSWSVSSAGSRNSILPPSSTDTSSKTPGVGLVTRRDNSRSGLPESEHGGGLRSDDRDPLDVLAFEAREMEVDVDAGREAELARTTSDDSRPR